MTENPVALEPAGSFRHDALLYGSAEQFVADTAAFVRDALAFEERIMVAVIASRASMLRDELGAEARGVRFLDMERVGRNPARIIPAWQDWVDENRARGRSFRGIAEPIWLGRQTVEIIECQYHESLLNSAFGPGPRWWLLCAYDVENLDRRVINRASDTHPVVVDADGSRASVSYPHPDLTTGSMFAAPLPETKAQLLCRKEFTAGDLGALRQTVARCGRSSGLGVERVADLVLAVDELTTNSVLYGGGRGRLRVWCEGGEIVAEVHDRGLIQNPFIGRVRPSGTAADGAGVWMVNQVCDLVQIRSTAVSGTTVRIRMALPER